MFRETKKATVSTGRAKNRLPRMLTVSRGSMAGDFPVFERRGHRLFEDQPGRDVERYIASLQRSDSHETDLLWCQVAEGRRTLEAIDPTFREALENPWDYADQADLTSALRKLRVLIRRARRGGLPLLATAWLPWLHTLQIADSRAPDLLARGKRMWSLIEPAHIQAEEGEACLTPEGFRFDTGELRPQTPIAAARFSTVG